MTDNLYLTFSLRTTPLIPLLRKRKLKKAVASLVLTEKFDRS